MTLSNYALFTNREVSETIENVWLQVKSVIVTKLQENEQTLSADSENVLKEQILSLAKEDSPVRKLMWKRLMAYVRLVKSGKTLPPVPPGYTDVTEQLQSLASTFKRLTIYNYSVFGEHCEKILEDLSKPEGEISENVSVTEGETTPKAETSGTTETNTISNKKTTAADAST